jgi:serine/threonine protein kinase
MSPEQFRGEVTSATDLYGVGACLLFLLSGQSPSAFPQVPPLQHVAGFLGSQQLWTNRGRTDVEQRRLKVDVSSVVAGARVKAVLSRLLEPAPEDRLQSASAAVSDAACLPVPWGKR